MTEKKPEPRTLQEDPPEGDRNTVERELKRQGAEGVGRAPSKDQGDTGRS